MVYLIILALAIALFAGLAKSLLIGLFVTFLTAVGIGLLFLTFALLALMTNSAAIGWVGVAFVAILEIKWARSFFCEPGSKK